MSTGQTENPTRAFKKQRREITEKHLPPALPNTSHSCTLNVYVMLFILHIITHCTYSTAVTCRPSVYEAEIVMTVLDNKHRDQGMKYGKVKKYMIPLVLCTCTCCCGKSPNTLLTRFLLQAWRSKLMSIGFCWYGLGLRDHYWMHIIQSLLSKQCAFFSLPASQSLHTRCLAQIHPEMKAAKCMDIYWEFLCSICLWRQNAWQAHCTF